MIMIVIIIIIIIIIIVIIIIIIIVIIIIIIVIIIIIIIIIILIFHEDYFSIYIAIFLISLRFMNLRTYRWDPERNQCGRAEETDSEGLNCH